MKESLPLKTISKLNIVIGKKVTVQQRIISINRKTFIAFLISLLIVFGWGNRSPMGDIGINIIMFSTEAFIFVVGNINHSTASVY